MGRPDRLGLGGGGPVIGLVCYMIKPYGWVCLADTAGAQAVMEAVME